MKTLLLIAALLLAACSASAPTAPAAVLPTPPSAAPTHTLLPPSPRPPTPIALAPTAAPPTPTAAPPTPTAAPPTPTAAPPTPTPTAAPTAAPPTLTPTLLPFERLVPTPPIPGQSYDTRTPLAAPAPFRVASLERVLLEPSGLAISWSPNARYILYGGQKTLYLFDTHTRQSDVVVQDMNPLPVLHRDSPIWPTWDHNYDAIIYPRIHKNAQVDVVAVTRQGKLLRTFVSNVLASERGYAIEIYPSNPPGSLAYNVSIASNGRVGVLRERDILSMRVGEPDRTLPLAPSALRRLQQQNDRDYHQLWLAPDGIHYALAVTRTLSIYRANRTAPLWSVELPTGEMRKEQFDHAPVSEIVGFLKWSPNSQAFLYEALYTSEGLGFYSSHWYVQHLNDAQPRELAGGALLPRADDGAPAPSTIAWSADGRWLTVSRPPAHQCQKPCVYSQTIVEPFAPRASIVWADEPSAGPAGVWSPDGKQIAFECSTTPSLYQTLMCILTLERQKE